MIYQAPKRVEYLDSLRGLAALFVLLGHIVGMYQWPVSFTTVQHLPFLLIFSDGGASVSFFFVLSGYVLSKPYLDRHRARSMLLFTFYLRRFTRIWIPWFIAFALSIYAKRYWYDAHPPPLKLSEWISRFWHAPITRNDFLKQCCFILHDALKKLLPQDWSLGVELKGSLLIPLFIYLIQKRRFFILGILSLLLLINSETGGCYVGFIMGVLVVYLQEDILKRLECAKRWQKFTWLVVGLLFYQTELALILAWGEKRWLYETGWILNSLGCVMILTFVMSSARAQSVLHTPLLIFLGKISYSVYLLQFIIILCFLPPILKELLKLGCVNAYFLILASGTILAFAGSLIFYYLVEVPAIWFGHRLTKLIQRRQPVG